MKTIKIELTLEQLELVNSAITHQILMLNQRCDGHKGLTNKRDRYGEIINYLHKCAVDYVKNEFDNLSPSDLFILEDCQQKNKDFPESFEIPTIFELKQLRVGDLVKLCFIPKNDTSSLTGERLWVEIREIGPNRMFKGIIKNDPVLIPLNYDDIVFFEEKHIANISFQK